MLRRSIPICAVLLLAVGVVNFAASERAHRTPIKRVYEGVRIRTGDRRADSLDITRTAVDRDAAGQVLGSRRYLRLQTDAPRSVAVQVVDEDGRVVSVGGTELKGSFDLRPLDGRLAVLEVLVRVKNNREVPPAEEEPAAR